MNTSAKVIEVNNWWRISYKSAFWGGLGIGCLGLLGYVISLVLGKRKAGEKQ